MEAMEACLALLVDRMERTAEEKNDVNVKLTKFFGVCRLFKL